MKRRAIILLSILIVLAGGLYYFFWERGVDYPDFDYDHVSILSADRSVLDTASSETIENLLMPYNNNATNGACFLDKSGRPFHKYYIKTDLSEEQIDEIHNCLRPGSFFGESRHDCFPSYRDVVVYYDKQNNPVGWIAICFECTDTDFSPNDVFISNSSIDRLEELFKKYDNGK